VYTNRYNDFRTLESDIMTYRNKFYVSFDNDSDVHYYWLIRAWQQGDGTKFDFYDAHDLNKTYNSSFQDALKQQLRARIQNTRAFVVLIGERTRYLQFVHWEIEDALALDLPIICVNLNGLRHRDIIRCPAIINDNLSVHIGFNAVILEHTLKTWPERHHSLKQQGDSSPYFYKPADYVRLGLETSDHGSRFESPADSEDGFSKKIPLWERLPLLRRTK